MVGVGAAKAVITVVLLIHSGGWLSGSPQSMDTAAKLARAHGMRPVEVFYPLGSLPRARKAVVQTARRWNRRADRVVALGESAGGTEALILAHRGLVSAAAANAPVADIPRWSAGLACPLCLGPESVQRANSPIHLAPAVPALVIASHDDDTVPAVDQGLAYWRKFAPMARFRWVPGGHIADAPNSLYEGPIYRANTSAELRWLAKR